MKKNIVKLSLSRETLRRLNETDLSLIAGRDPIKDSGSCNLDGCYSATVCITGCAG